MPLPSINSELLRTLKRRAKRLSREDLSLTYNQWLDALSASHGYRTFSSLGQRVKELEAEAQAQQLALQENQWEERFQKGLIWGCLASETPNTINETIPLPSSPGKVAWPNCFAGSSLFNCADGPRRHLDGPVFSMDGLKMHFRGEELRVADDEQILMALICLAAKHPCGRLLEFSCADLDKATGLPLSRWGMPVHYESISKSLWRLTHGELTVDDFKFKGPILLYADAREHPRKFAIRFNPAFAHFYYPVLSWIA